LEQGVEQLQVIGIPIWVFDVDHSRVVWGNPLALKHWNAESLEELTARDMSEDMSAAVKTRLQQIRSDCLTTGKCHYEEWTLYPNNAPVTARICFSVFGLQDNRTALLVQVVSEVIDTGPRNLHSMQALMHTSAMITLFGNDLSLIYCNPAARDALGDSEITLDSYISDRQQLHATLVTLQQSGSYDIECEVSTTSGMRWHSMSIRTSPDPVSGERTILVSANDITEQRKVQQEAITRAYTDSLTGLPNRLALLENIRTRVADGLDAEFALLFLDLDRFKRVNDSLGHQIGDALLKDFANTLTALVRPSDYVARLSGDEFVVLLAKSGRREAIGIVERIFSKTAEPRVIEGHNLRVVPSIGVSLYPTDGDGATALLQAADIAMYAAKSSGNGFCCFDLQMAALSQNRLSIENEMLSAISEGQFELFYQPKIDTHTLDIVGMEALIRWRHPEKGLISPMDFIPVAEESGMILQIGSWVMQQAMLDQVRWEKQGFRVSVAINVSPRQFASRDFVSQVDSLLQATGCAPQRVNIEVTESMLIGDEQHAQQLLNDLADRGISISIDDFGTGYSNLANLQKYPIHVLKIDRAFLADSSNTELLQVILQMGNILNLLVVAEGVETSEQIEWLRRNGCDELQGYYFSKPLPYNDILKYMRDYIDGHTLQAAAA